MSALQVYYFLPLSRCLIHFMHIIFLTITLFHFMRITLVLALLEGLLKDLLEGLLVLEVRLVGRQTHTSSQLSIQLRFVTDTIQYSYHSSDTCLSSLYRLLPTLLPLAADERKQLIN